MWLAIETSSLVSSVALMNTDMLLGEITVQAGLTHSEQLVPHIDTLLKLCNKNKKELTAIVVSIGPGSFTGLRIGMGTAKTMAYALNIPLYGIMTMDGLAYNVPYTDRLISVIIDAQKKNVYESRYKWVNNTLQMVQEPIVKASTDVVEELRKGSEEVLFLGDGIKRIISSLEVSDSPHLLVASVSDRIPKASSLLRAASSRMESEDCDDPRTLTPYYIRRSEAEVLWEEKYKDDAAALAHNPTVVVTEAANLK